MYVYATLKLVKVILRRGRRKRKNNGGDSGPNLLHCTHIW
jgi:hypothetical protein